MNKLERYIDIMVEPIVADFDRNPSSIAHLGAACLSIFHTVDRVGIGGKGVVGNAKAAWAKESPEFSFVEFVANKSKHGSSDQEKFQYDVNIPLHTIVSERDEDLCDVKDIRNMWFVVHDALRFVKSKAAAYTEDDFSKGRRRKGSRRRATC